MAALDNNGNRWLTWPLVAFALMAALGAGGALAKIHSTEVREIEIEKVIRTHTELPGHAPSLKQQENVKESLKEIKDDMKDIKKDLKEIREMLLKKSQ